MSFSDLYRFDLFYAGNSDLEGVEMAYGGEVFRQPARLLVVEWPVWFWLGQQTRRVSLEVQLPGL